MSGGAILLRRSVRVIVTDAPHRAGEVGAATILAAVREKGLRTLGVATGSSPLPIYAGLAAHRRELVHLRAFALDEYVGIPLEHPQSYHSVVHDEVTLPLGLDPARVSVPDGSAVDLDRAATDYEESIAAAGGIDLQIVGIGANGHIGFNEPGAAFDSRTRRVGLAPQTLLDNARYFDSPGDVPAEALTQGIGTIMESRAVVLIATGAAKSAAVAAALDGPIDVGCPASVLRQHPDLTVILDRAAASRLSRRIDRDDTSTGEGDRG